MRPVLAILAATVWISLNEFLRNQLFLIDHWTAHYAAMGLTFPGDPVNGAVWGLWSLCFAVAIFVMARRFSLLETGALASTTPSTRCNAIGISLLINSGSFMAGSIWRVAGFGRSVSV
jgi:hypothetical protein